MNTEGTQKHHILLARAHALAREDAQRHAAEESLIVVEFLLAHERYAVEAVYVREVYQLKQLTPVPCTPSFVLGIINVRGCILSVIDLRGFFDLPQDWAPDQHSVIILRTDELELGVLTDGILGARSIPASAVQASPLLPGIRAEYLRGVTSEHTVILAAEKILSDKKMIVSADEVEI
jgi:purine-binding chemotaxis protein CheW